MPYGALKLRSARDLYQPAQVAETPMPYGALKPERIAKATRATKVAEAPMPYGGLCRKKLHGWIESKVRLKNNQGQDGRDY